METTLTPTFEMNEETMTSKAPELTPSEARSRRTSKGIKVIPAGALILVVSCILSLTVPSSSFLYDYILYGLTSVGAVIAFYGLYLVME